MKKQLPLLPATWTLLLLLTISFLFFAPFELASSSAKPLNTVGKLWSTSGEGLAPEEWKALWIWRKGANQGVNLFLLARKEFVLDAKPDKATMYITADNLYELYVNGILVNRGPVRCQPHHQFYDILEISSLLKEGNNVLAIRVLHHGSYGSFNLGPRPGLLAQLEVRSGDSVELICTNSSFRVNVAEWINTASVKYCELVDMRKEETGWQQLGFDDSKWQNAEELVSDTYLSWPGPSPKSRPITLTSPWKNLIARDIPYLKESLIKAVDLFETGEIMELQFSSPVSEGLHGLLFPLEKCNISGKEEYKKGTGPLIIQNSYPKILLSNDAIYSTYMIFDFGKIVHGYPEFEINAEAGTIIELVYATNLLRGKFPMRSTMQGRPTTRPSTDRIILKKGVNAWSPMDMKYMRYLLVAVRNTDKPVEISFAGINRADYPFEPRGSFNAGKDEELNWIWQAAKNTLDAVTTDAYTDNYRERLQYSQTSYYTSRCSYAAYGDPYLQRRYLMQVALEQQSDGIMPASAPGFETKGQRFLDASLFWIYGLHDYYLHSGENLTSQLLLPAAEKMLDTFSKWENRDGLIESPPYTYWIDHANIERFGANFSFNAMYLLAMKDVMNLCKWIGEVDRAAVYENRINKLSSQMQKLFWNDQEKLFRDVLIEGELTGNYTEHSNSLAIVAGIATPEQQKAIVWEMTENRSERLVKATLFMHYITEALFMSGEGQAAVNMLKDRYRHMKEEGAQTLWEHWGETVEYNEGIFQPISYGTVSQAENTYQTYSLSKWMLGVHPVKPGMKEVIIAANLCGLPEVKGIMPTPQGDIRVLWSQNKKGLILEIEIPLGVKAMLDLNSLKKKQKIIINGNDGTVNFIKQPEIPAGSNRLEFY